jgi:acetyl-CoA carboxylase carboxyl transferase subunit beta
MHYRPEFEAALRVCPTCNYHDRMDAAERITLLLDNPHSFVEIDADITAADPIEFVRPSGSYIDRVAKARALTNRNEAIVCGTGLLNKRRVAIGVMEFGFIAGSMGSATGEKITRLFEMARREHLPVITVTSSGGARQDEGLFALMQMARTTAAATRLQDVQMPHICVMADPTLAGVTASFASIADIIIGEPGATIRFAGSRVVKGTIRRRSNVEDHTSEWVQQHGMIDLVLGRHELRETLALLISHLAPVTSTRPVKTTTHPVIAPN